MKIKLFFHYISYLQYPLMLVALFFAFKPYFNGFEISNEKIDLVFRNLNTMLVFMGLSISFSTLQDTTKTQNKMSRKIWENPKKGKLVILIFSLSTLFLITIGLIGYFNLSHSKLKEISIGIIVLGIGLVGMLKVAIEMFENHRKDKNTTANNQ